MTNLQTSYGSAGWFWFGHVYAWTITEHLKCWLYLWKPTHGKRRRGRPRTTWRDVIQRDLTFLDTGWSVEKAEVAAQDRTIWKIFTSRVGQQVQIMHDAFHDDDDDYNIWSPHEKKSVQTCL